ncbi:UNVERIFIED_CONTAM: hypothetical protein PYX00_000738 [Menopon gallinae]|uniref:Iron-binding zinc finger CDGSH type domain-containing protein n=1 Tax=Menopon gallinae TaxID=328185 RepID=A0AAW2IAD8_9NEOP
MIFHKTLGLHKFFRAHRLISTTKNRQCKFRHIDKVIPKNVLEYRENNSLQTKNGKVYDLKPMKIPLEKGKVYAWCLCGCSKSQPLCDATHDIAEMEIKLKPIFFKVENTGEYWLCNCKQTKHRPFCDGSHVKLANEEREKERLKKKEAAERKRLEAAKK